MFFLLLAVSCFCWTVKSSVRLYKCYGDFTAFVCADFLVCLFDLWWIPRQRAADSSIRRYKCFLRSNCSLWLLIFSSVRALFLLWSSLSLPFLFLIIILAPIFCFDHHCHALFSFDHHYRSFFALIITFTPFSLFWSSYSSPFTTWWAFHCLIALRLKSIFIHESR